ncbi:DUF3017 domain-containing protein [Tessaracoccus defluvii]|uniref:DUF3017 domain-containing protein n=1 Tax=Tessaracoccus defluvii TaxID=1285901 RepID=A0A7H0H9V0_9ACTN|nr:DUF3017 domain-containing protein [Tessaracoccus defluvii]QNP57316.1 DUF3017 domain-containing protein [Tessaracoccus defluvii]
MADRPDKPVDWYPDRPGPLLVSLALVGVGAALAAVGQWRAGAIVIAGALLVAAVFRLVLPRRHAGLLVVRRRWLDVLVLGALGVGTFVLALVVPPGR